MQFQNVLVREEFEPTEDHVKAEHAKATIYVSKAKDEEILREALTKEIMRKVQSMRKDFGFKVTDKIILTIAGSKETLKLISQESVGGKVGAVSITLADDLGQQKFKDSLEMEGEKILIGFDRV